MNEIELIRAQLATERAHAASVVRACSRVLTQDAQGEASIAACGEYLASVLRAFDARDLRLEQLCARLPETDALRRASAQAPGGSGREAVELLHASLADGSREGSSRPARWQRFARCFEGAWSARHAAIEALIAAHPRVSDWRAVAAIDADSILAERRSYARVRERLPAAAGPAAPA